jgi:hypothetical protein
LSECSLQLGYAILDRDRWLAVGEVEKIGVDA